ncbi:MAG: N-acetylmuramoyl-L-alanine amidase [Oscillospiraceae bacterium]|nr:N-acetylmuramoyl-L-alanine amidase [Oscillospiraceae bacterium]
MKKWCYQAANWLLLLLLALGTVFYAVSDWEEAQTAFSAVRSAGEQLILDAGHGGEDGGAVSLSGVPESGINLSIVLKLDQILGLYGISPILLRSEDRSLHDAGAQTLREKKVSDLHNRVAAVEAVDQATLFSIHQNTYENPNYHGAQVFYTNGEISLPLAQFTQELLRQGLDPDNHRKPAKIPDSVYLMKHISCRAILIECGFLSNPEEDQALQSESYQGKIAISLATAWLRRDEAELIISKTE